MALLADVTREEQRTKAMAAMGMSISISFVVAFSLKILAHKPCRYFWFVLCNNHHGFDRDCDVIAGA